MNLRFLKFVAAASVLAPFAAHAQMDPTPSADRILSDPLYLPLQGQFYGDTNYEWATTTQDVFNAAGVKTESQRVSSNNINQAMEYGITDDIAINASIGYDPSQTTKTNPVGGTSSSRDSEGWTDPQFGVVWRVLDQRNQPLTLDLRGSYSPDAFNAKSATDTDDGNVARGGDAFDLGATLGHEMRGFTIAGTFDAEYDGRRTIENQSTGFNNDVSSNWIYTLGLATQTRFTDQLSLNAGLGYEFPHNATVFNEGSGIAHETNVRGTTNLNAALNYHFIPNILVGSVEYRHDFDGNEDNTYVVPASDTEARNKSADVVGLRLRYVFQ